MFGLSKFFFLCAYRCTFTYPMYWLCPIFTRCFSIIQKKEIINIPKKIAQKNSVIFSIFQPMALQKFEHKVTSIFSFSTKKTSVYD